MRLWLWFSNMADETDNGGGNVSWRMVLAQTFVKSGPWAVLCILILGAIWYEADKFLAEYIRAQNRYISQSSENIVTLQHATRVLTDTVTRNTERFAHVADSVHSNHDMLVSIQKLMIDASAMMEGAPERSKRMLAALEQIEKLLRQQQSERSP